MEFAFLSGIFLGTNLILTIFIYKKVEQMEQNLFNLVNALTENTEENENKYM